jgi:Family of unknown function (DUF695)
MTDDTQTDAARRPTPQFALREGWRDGAYSVAMVNHALKDYAFRSDYPWHLTIQAHLREMNAEGLPTPAEASELNAFEDRVEELLSGCQQAHFVARVTRKNFRDLHWYLVDPKSAAQSLQQLIDRGDYTREFEFDIRRDPSWREVAGLFDYSSVQ